MRINTRKLKERGLVVIKNKDADGTIDIMFENPMKIRYNDITQQFRDAGFDQDDIEVELDRFHDRMSTRLVTKIILETGK
jgi:hypothetical protein